MGNRNLRKAAKAKNDEFYTRLTDIEKEVLKYVSQFKDKVVYLNCDDPMYENIDGEMEVHEDGSQFWNFFYLQFERLGLKKLIATHYDESKPTYKLEYTGGGVNNIVKTPLKENGDFRSEEAIECLKEADIVCTNPPFSLFREYITQLIEYDKKFLIIGNFNAVTYKEIFSLIKNDKIWLGYSPRNMVFRLPDGELKSVNACWFTNMEVSKRSEDIFLYREYYGNEDKYPKYDNYDAIEVGRVKDIPKDYEGYMGVPITFLTQYNPEQFEILGIMNTGEENPGIRLPGSPHGRPVIDGKEKYLRYIVRNRRPELENRDLGIGSEAEESKKEV